MIAYGLKLWALVVDGPGSFDGFVNYELYSPRSGI